LQNACVSSYVSQPTNLAKVSELQQTCTRPPQNAPNLLKPQRATKAANQQISQLHAPPKTDKRKHKRKVANTETEPRQARSTDHSNSKE